MFTAALFIQYKPEIKKLNYSKSICMMEVKAVIKKNEVDLSVLIWKC